MPRYYNIPTLEATRGIQELKDMGYDVNNYYFDASMTFMGRHYLYDCVREAKPVHAAEVGAAFGCSAITIMKAMGDTEGSLQSIDKYRSAYNSGSNKTTAAWARQYAASNFPGHYSVLMGAVSPVYSLRMALQPIDFLLIDAEHCSPWPLMDFLSILPHLSPHARVVFHDIYRKDRNYQSVVNAGIAGVLGWKHVADYSLCAGTEWIGEDGWEAACVELDDVPFAERDKGALLLGMMYTHNVQVLLERTEKYNFMRVLQQYYSGTRLADELISRLDEHLERCTVET